MLHPVGDLPAGVYWRRRVVALLILLAVLGGAGWLGWWLLAGRDAGTADGAATTSPRAQVRPPALERVVPAMEGVRTPEAGAGSADRPATEATDPVTDAAADTGAPAPDGPCTDDILGVAVRAPATVTIGSTPTLELVVTNASAVPCVRALDKELQEITLHDAAGTRVWGSNDCIPEASDDIRTLAPGQEVVFSLVWIGRTSQPGCAGERTLPAPGNYVLRGRLDTKASGDTPLVLA